MSPPIALSHRSMPSLEARRLRSRLRSFAVGPELLYDLMGFGAFAEMAMTRDGMVIARPHRSTGFDAFIGRLSLATLDRTARIWHELDRRERDMVLARLETLAIRPDRVGIPIEMVPNHPRHAAIARA